MRPRCATVVGTVAAVALALLQVLRRHSSLVSRRASAKALPRGIGWWDGDGLLRRGIGFAGAVNISRRWWAAAGSAGEAGCGTCVLDPLAFPDIFCSARPSNGPTARPSNGTTVWPSSSAIEVDDDVETDSWMDALLQSLPRGGAHTTVGVLGDSFMLQALDAIACELRRMGRPDTAGFIKWPVVDAHAGTVDDASRPERYNWAGPHGRGPTRWYVLTQMYFNRDEVAKLLAASDVVIVSTRCRSQWLMRAWPCACATARTGPQAQRMSPRSRACCAYRPTQINYGLHYCQPVRPGADWRCQERFRQYEAEMHELLRALQAFAVARPGRVAILQESSAQHFPGMHGGAATGDWEYASPGLQRGASEPNVRASPTWRLSCLLCTKAALGLQTGALPQPSATHTRPLSARPQAARILSSPGA